MPNQYTKYKAALQNAQPYEYRWKDCSGQKPRKPKTAKLKVSPAHEKQSGRQLKSTTMSLLLYTPSTGLRVDPFRSYPVKPSHAELSVLDHFLSHLTPSASQNTLVLGRTKSPDTDPHVKYLLPYVLHEAPLFDALLATCQAQIMLSAGSPAYSNEFFVLHRGRAMSGLRRQLESNTDTSAMLAITMLLTCDYLTGDLRAVAGHARALERMLQLRGDMPQETVWDRFVKKGVHVYKTISYMATGTQVTEDLPQCQLDVLVNPLRALEYPQPPFSMELCREWSKLPQGFCDLILASSISTQLVQLLLAVNNVDSKIGEQLNEALKITAPIQAALQRFLQHKDATVLERIVASGLLTYTFQYPRITVPNMFHDPPMQGIINILANPNGIQAGFERDLLVWTHVVVEGFAYYRSSRLPGTRNVYLNALRKHPIMQDWPKLELVLERFFFSPDLLRRWKACHSSCPAAYPDQIDVSDSTSSSDSVTLSELQSLPLTQPPACPFSGGESRTPRAKCPFSQLSVG